MAGAMASGIIRPILISFLWLMGRNMFRSANGPSDGLVEIEAEDRFNFKDRLSEIKTPALVIGGEHDGFYPVRETGNGIPSARVIIYLNSGHMASIKSSFNKDILAFLTE
jgi:pimeloyl-ACP methyl ester carboxylesterase